MLKREISTTSILVVSAGGMVGSGWLFSPYISAQLAGSNALISWIIVTIFMLFIALPLCELGSMFPVSGGMSNYPTFTHGKEVGFLYAWTSWLSYVVMTPIEIQAILQYSSHFFPQLVSSNQHAILTLSPLGYVAAVCIMLFVVALNSYGIKILAECNKYASLIKFILPTIAIIALLKHNPHYENLNIHLSSKNDWVGIFTALSTGGVAFAFTGFQNGLILAGEVKNPQRNIPIAILGAVLIGFVLYFMLQLSFLVAMPSKYLSAGWGNLSYPGDSGPLVGLTLLLGLTIIATLLMIDAAFSPFGTTLVYTAATSRILYGMAINQHLPKLFLKTNKYNIPYVTLYVNLLVGMFSFLPFPGWQKLVTFLSSASILSYGIGPVCLLAMRKLQPNTVRPFKLPASFILSHIAFYVCNLMLYWCGFDILWKLDVALAIGLIIYLFYHQTHPLRCNKAIFWFILYMAGMLALSYVGTFDGIGLIRFPLDMVIILLFSTIILGLSQSLLSIENHSHVSGDMDEMTIQSNGAA